MFLSLSPLPSKNQQMPSDRSSRGHGPWAQSPCASEAVPAVRQDRDVLLCLALGCRELLTSSRARSKLRCHHVTACICFPWLYSPPNSLPGGTQAWHRWRPLHTQQRGLGSCAGGGYAHFEDDWWHSSEERAAVVKTDIRTQKAVFDFIISLCFIIVTMKLKLKRFEKSMSTVLVKLWSCNSYVSESPFFLIKKKKRAVL